MFRVFALLAVCVLTGAKAQLEHQADALNRATALTMSEQVLLNAVRASLDLPMSFTKLQRYTANSMTSGSLAPKVPFGADAAIVNDLGASVSISPGVFQIEYADVNTAGALTKLNESLQYDAIDRYLRDGVPGGVMLTIFGAYVEVHEKLAIVFQRQYREKCHARKKIDDATSSICRELDRIHREERCPFWYAGKAAIMENGGKFYTVSNNANSKCDFMTFQSFRLMLRLAEFISDLVPGEKRYETALTPEKVRVRVPKESKPEQFVTFQDPRIQKAYGDIDRHLKKYKAKREMSHRAPIKFSARSPRQVLTYLGELIALQNFGDQQFVPRVITGGSGPITIFRVLRGVPSAEPTALAVTGPYGERYYVPHPEYGSPGRDQTLRVLWITAELVNGAISEKDFPAPTSITVRSAQ